MKAKRLFPYIFALLSLLFLAACMPGGDVDVAQTETPDAPTIPDTPEETPAVATPTAEATDTPAAETSPPADHDLTGTAWTLQSFGPVGSETPVLEDTRLILSFDSASELGGTGGCNSFGAGYTVENGALELGELVSTLIACEEQEVMDQELRFYEALRDAGQYEISGEELTIWYNDGESAMHFSMAGGTAAPPTPPESETSLSGTHWQLESMGPTASEAPVVEGSEVSLAFESANEVTGTGGCNSFGSEYEAQDGMISFGEIVQTEIACEDQDIMEQEQNYFQALQSAQTFTQTADSLTIFYDDGQSALNFTPRAP